MKNCSQEKRTELIIDSLASLGKNNREIAKELKWFSDNDILLKVLNIPSTEFMQLAGLKKGTFYNLLKQYKEQQAFVKKEA